MKRGQAGGRALVAKYGRDHMQTIGRKGAESFWLKYHVSPRGLNNFAIVERSTGRVVGYMIPRG